MFIVRLLLMAVIGALIGWLTNKIALLSLFRPYRPKKILGLFTIQGILPKRQKVIAKDIGETVAKELINVDDVIDELFSTNEETKKRILKKPFDSLSSTLENKFPTLTKLKPKTFLKKFVKVLTARVDVAKLVEGKLNDLSMEELEELVVGIVKTEFRHIELLGGILGFIIGTIQGLITLIV